MVDVDGQLLLGTCPPLWTEEEMVLLRRPRAARDPFWCGNGRAIGCARRYGREARVPSETYARVLS